MFHEATVLGGLPVIVDVWFSGPDYEGEYDSGVDAVYWKHRNGSTGSEFSLAMYNKLEKYDKYWQAGVTEQVSEALAYEKYADEKEDQYFQLT